MSERIDDRSPLESLAELHGIELSYASLTGETRAASTEALLAILRALGVPIGAPEEATAALVRAREERVGRPLEPVTVIWEGARQPLRLLAPAADARVECRLQIEGGEFREWEDGPGPIRLPDDLPVGYHRLHVEAGGRASGTLLVHAPRTLHAPHARGWGVFLPLYALRTSRQRAVGDWTDLEALAEWAGRLGGEVVGTLPLLAGFLDAPFDPSPYAPVSRLFWNELYVDPERSPELERSAEARGLLESRERRARLTELAGAPLVDYREAALLNRRVLEALARSFWTGDGPSSAEFGRFEAEVPEARAYAAFRAACASRAEGWRRWPQRMRHGRLEATDVPEDEARYHHYAQWLAWRQSGAVARRSAATGVGLYLDFPVGVHSEGFDTWRFRPLFAEGVSVGAPPDDFFAGGQDWGFPPLHPQRIREDGYGYVVASLRTLMRRASTLRLDHVMALHRLYWVPHGMGATEGVYVRYRPEEWWAILCLESRRHRTEIVGEDLGTVLPEVREAMERHRARRMYVVPFEIEDGARPRLREVPARAVASLDTHDMPPFAGWWRAAGERRRREIERALSADGAAAEAGDPPPEDERLRRARDAALRWLARSPARLVLVNLENLWLEHRPQNEPGTTMEERPNWRRRARLSLEEMGERREIVETLSEIDRIRKEGGDP